MKKLIIKGMDKRYFSDKIVKWYLENKRNLPWRRTNDPYKIWLSEIILQQTRVIQGLPYYLRFVDRYPTVIDLANAPEQDVLRLWQGLGYYTRARNLHKCAKVVASTHHGAFPRSFEELKKLPGVGDYTAAAIASIAFSERVAVVDGNVFRVLSRLFGIDAIINSPEGKKQFTALANELVPVQQPDIHNQAVMEFGALFCTPKNPSCPACTFQNTCFAFQHSLQHALPVKSKAKPGRKRYFNYIVLQHGKSLLMKKREQKDIWLGLYDFPLIETNRSASIDTLAAEHPGLKKLMRANTPVVVTEPFRHVLTHQTILSKFIVIRCDKKVQFSPGSGQFYSLDKISGLPKPVLVTRFLESEYLLI